MSNIVSNRIKKIAIADFLLIFLFLFSIIMSCIMVYFTSLNLLDSDASAELVLADHLYKTGRLLSTDWYYSTELRVLHSNLIFMPLFGLFSLWRRVRFVGTLIMHAILVASFGYYGKQAHFSRRVFLLGSSLLLLPISTTYGRDILVHAYYIFYVAISFLTTALFLACISDMQKKTSLYWKLWHFIAYLGLSFAGALNGYRQISTTQLPLVLVCTLPLLKTWLTKKTILKTHVQMMLFALLGSLASLLGLFVNSHLHNIYSFVNFSGTRLDLMDFSQLDDLLTGFMHQFGYRRYVTITSMWGILSILSLVVVAYFSCRCVQVVRQPEVPQEVGNCLSGYMFPCALAVCILLTLFVTRDGEQSMRYFLPFSVWMIPFICMDVTNLPTGKSLRKCIVLSICVLCLINGTANSIYFWNPSAHDHPYEGLSWDSPTTVEDLSPIRDHLIADSYDVGYCSCWYANVLVEMSNGALRFIPIAISNDGVPAGYYNWLALESNRSLEAKKPFVLLTKDETISLGADYVNEHFRLVGDFGVLSLYEPINFESWRQELDAAPQVP